MKKTILFLSFIFAISTLSAADNVVAPAVDQTPQPVVQPVAKTAPQAVNSNQQSPLDQWTFFQLGFWFNQPSATANSNVYGIKTGWPISSGYGSVNGLEASWVVAGTDHVQGLQACWVYTGNKEMQGVQASLACNVNKERFRGLQAGLVNVAGNIQGFQPGAVNVSNNVMGVQAAALTNVSNGEVVGAQLGLLNFTHTLNGFQASAFNHSQGKSDGFQLGFVNISNTSGGFQFGIANYIRDAWIPFLPFFNFSF